MPAGRGDLTDVLQLLVVERPVDSTVEDRGQADDPVEGSSQLVAHAGQELVLGT